MQVYQQEELIKGNDMIENNVDLSKMTTFRIGGLAEKLYSPENYDELLFVMDLIGDNDFKTISGGSNLLINDQKVFEHVVSLSRLDRKVVHKGGGVFYLGASARIQSVIREVNQFNYGGLEQFYSIPALVGGMIYMNAGIGKKKNDAIGDYVISVDAFVDGAVKTYSQKECKFSYRSSIFQRMPRAIILGATVQLAEMEKEIAEERIRKRMEYVKQTQDHSGANFGTLCSEADTRLIAISRWLHKGNPQGVHFSTKKPNCLINSGGGTYKEAVKLIRSVKRIHKLFRKKCTLEVSVWD